MDLLRINKVLSMLSRSSICLLSCVPHTTRAALGCHLFESRAFTHHVRAKRNARCVRSVDPSIIIKKCKSELSTILQIEPI